MATRNRLVKVPLADTIHMSLLGAIVVGQHGDTLIVERAESKPRQRTTGTRKPRAARVNSKPTPADRAMGVLGATGPAPMEAQRG